MDDGTSYTKAAARLATSAEVGLRSSNSIASPRSSASFNITGCNLGRALIGQIAPGELFVFLPGGVRQGHDDSCAVDAELHVNGVGVAQGDRRLQVNKVTLILLFCERRLRLKVAVVHIAML